MRVANPKEQAGNNLFVQFVKTRKRTTIFIQCHSLLRLLLSNFFFVIDAYSLVLSYMDFRPGQL